MRKSTKYQIMLCAEDAHALWCDCDAIARGSGSLIDRKKRNERSWTTFILC